MDHTSQIAILIGVAGICLFFFLLTLVILRKEEKKVKTLKEEIRHYKNALKNKEEALRDKIRQADTYVREIERLNKQHTQDEQQIKNLAAEKSSLIAQEEEIRSLYNEICNICESITPDTAAELPIPHHDPKYQYMVFTTEKETNL